MKRLVVSDFDVTLYRKNDLNHMTRALESIKRFNCDTAFAVASGRPLHLLKPTFDKIDRVYIISNDGALITRNGKILYEYPIEKSLITECCKEHDWVAYGECISYMHVTDMSYAKKIVKMYNGHVTKADNIDSIKENIYKIFFTDNIKHIQGLEKSYEKYGVSEFTASGVDKGKALRYLSGLLGVKKENIIAFGDNENDIPLFAAAGKSYAYINASPKVRACADDVFSDITERIVEYEKL